MYQIRFFSGEDFDDDLLYHFREQGSSSDFQMIDFIQIFKKFAKDIYYKWKENMIIFLINLNYLNEDDSNKLSHFLNLNYELWV